MAIDPTKPKSGGVMFDFAQTPETVQSNGSSLGQGYVPATLNDPSGVEAFMNENQGGFHTFANWLAQATGSAVLGTVEAASYLGDWQQIGDKLQGDEKEYDNWLAQSMRDAKEGLKEAAPIYRSKEGQETFSPGSRSFWTSNSPDVIGSVIGLMVPGTLIGKVAKGLATLAKAGKGVQRFTELTATVGASRYAEATMEANQVFQSSYKDNLAAGMTNDEARDYAGQAASRTWNYNWLLATQDLFQYGTLLKGLNTSSKLRKGLGLSDLITQPASEAAEEGVQYVLSEEAKKSGLAKGQNFFTNGFWNERLSDYVNSEEFKASTSLGALGGGIFMAPTKLGEIRNKQANMNLQALAKERANYVNDIGTSKKIDNMIFNDLAFKNLDAGTLDEFKEDLEAVSKDADTTSGIKQHLDDLDFIIDQQAQIKASPIPKELHQTALSDYLDLRQSTRLQKDLEKRQDEIYGDLEKSGELFQGLKELKKAKIFAEAASKIDVNTIHDPEIKQRVAQAQTNFAQMLEPITDKEGILKNIVTARDQELGTITKQAILNSNKVTQLKTQIAKYATPEGRAEALKEAQEKKVMEQATAQAADPKATKEQIKATMESTTNPKVKETLAKKLEDMDHAESQANQDNVVDNIPDADYQPDFTHEPDFEDNTDPNTEIDPESMLPDFDQEPVEDDKPWEEEIDPLQQPLENGLTYEENKGLFGETTAKALLAKLSVEQNPTPPPQPQVVQENKEEGKQRLKEYKTVPTWSKFYKGYWKNDEFVPEIAPDGTYVPQMYYDSNSKQNVPATEVFETDQHGHPIVDTPLVKEGDKVILVVENDFKYKLNPDFTPTTGSEVINVYRANKEGKKIGNKPIAQLPSSDNKAAQSEELTQLRSKVINSPNKSMVTVITSKNIGDAKKAKGRNTVDILEFDYHLTDAGNWVYGKTGHNPIFAMADINYKLIAPNADLMKGVDMKAVETALEMPKSKGNVKGGVFTLRMNPEGNLRPVLVYPRDINSIEDKWLRDNLGKLLAEGAVNPINEVYYIPQHGAGVLSTDKGRKIPDIANKRKIDRRRLQLIQLTNDNSTLLIPIMGKDENGNSVPMWVTLQASGSNPMVDKFMKGEPFTFSYINHKGQQVENNYNSWEAPADQVQKVRDAFEAVFNNKESHKRNITKSSINTEGTYTDPATGESYPSYYDFLKIGAIETDLPGSNTKGYGPDSSYSFANARVRVSPNPTESKFKIDNEEIKPIKLEPIPKYQQRFSVEIKDNDAPKMKGTQIVTLTPNSSALEKYAPRDTVVQLVNLFATNPNLKLISGGIQRMIESSQDWYVVSRVRDYLQGNISLETLKKDLSDLGPDNAKLVYQALLNKTTIKPMEELKKPEEELTKDTGKTIEQLLAERFGAGGEGTEEKTRLVSGSDWNVITPRELDWFRDTYGDEFVSVAHDVDRVIAANGLEAFGLYHNALITVADLAEKGTTYHEAFHFVFDPKVGFVSSKEREKVLAEARKIRNISDEALEEMLAEDFRKYMLSNGREIPKGPAIKGFFNKLWNAIKKLIGMKSPIQKLFEDAADGRRMKPELRTKAWTLQQVQLNEQEKYRMLPGFSSYKHQNEAIQATVYEVMNLAQQYASETGKELINVLQEKGILDKLLQAVREDFGQQMLAIEKSKNPNDMLKYYTFTSMGVILESGVKSNQYQGNWEDVKGELQPTPGFKTEVLKAFKQFGFSVNLVDKTMYPGEENAQATDDFTEQEVIELRQEDEGERVYDQDHTERSPNNTLSIRMKLFLSSIEEPGVQKTIIGTPKYINFNRVMSNLKTRLADSISPITKLADLATRDQFSSAVFEALAKAQQVGNYQVINEFNTGINLALHNFKSIIHEYDPSVGYVVPRFIDTDRASINKSIKNKWRDNTVSKKFMQSDGTPDRAKFEATLKELTDYKAKFDAAKGKKSNIPYVDVKNEFVSLLKKIGIEVSEQVFADTEGKNPNSRYNTLEGWFFGEQRASLQQFLVNGKDGQDPYDGTSGITDILARRAKNYVDDIKGDVFLNEFNDQVNPINLPSYITELIQKKGRDKEEGDALKKYFQQYGFYKNNKLVELFGTRSGQSINLDFISALRVSGGKPKDFAKRTPGESILARMTSFYNSAGNMAAIFVGTFSDKSKQATISVPKKRGQAAYNFLLDVLVETTKAEARRINLIKDNPTFEFPDNYKLRGSKFLYVPEMPLQVSQSLTKGEISVQQSQDNDALMAKTAKEHIDSQYNAFENFLLAKGLITKDEDGNLDRGKLPAALLSGYNKDANPVSKNAAVKNAIKEYFHNDYAWRIEISKVMMGDLALYKNDDDYFKRGYQVVTPGTVPSNETIIPDEPDGAKHFYRFIYPKQIFKRDEAEMKELAKTLGPELAELYKSVNKTDAQSYVNTTTYRRLTSAWGGWTKEMEDLYQFAWKPTKKFPLGMTVNQAVKENKVDRETGDRYKKLINDVHIQVLKPFQFNDREITLPDGTKELIKEQFKDSMMWLNPELTNRHTELGKLSKFMFDNEVDVASAADSVKVGSYGIAKDFETPLAANQKRKVAFSDIRFPQMMPDKKKDHVLGTQFWKLITGNLDPKDKRIAEYNKLWEQKIKESADSLRGKIGLDENWQLSTDPKKRGDQLFKLKILLQNELSNRNVTDNYEDSIEIQPTATGPNFMVHLGFPMYARKFMSILTNLFKKNVLQQDSPGFAMVNFADFGVNKAEKSSNLKMVEENGALIAEIGLPVDFFREIGLNFKDDVDQDSHKIKWEKLSDEQKKSLEFILYRIPTSNKSSMTPVRVAMVLPESSGNVVMLPGELTVQQGLDFDVDKSQLLRRVLKDNKIDNDNVDTKLFELAWSILTEKQSVQEVYTPLDFETIVNIYQNYVKRGIISPTSASAVLSAATDVDFEIRNKHGKAMIGIDSRANTAHAVLQTIPDYVRINVIPFDIKMESNDPDDSYKLGYELDTEGTLISKNYGELQQSSLDNAKNPLKALLNIFPATDPILLYLTGIGVPLATSFAFMNQPIVREWMKYFDQEGGSSSDKASKALLEANPSIDAQYKLIKDNPKLIQLTEATLKADLGKDYNDDPTRQAKVLYEFLRLYGLAQVMTKVNNVLSVDTFRDMTGVEPLEVFMNQRDDVTNPDSPITIDKSIFDLTKAPVEAKRLAAFYKYGIEDANAFIAQFAPYSSPAYVLAKETLANMQGQDRVTDKETLKKLNTFLDYHVLETTGKLAPILTKLSPDYTQRWKLLDKNKSIWNYIEKVMKQYPTLKDNALIKNILTYPSMEDNVQMIGVINTSSNINRNDMTQGWYDLLHSPKPEVKQLGNDLIRFALVTSGLGFNTKSFIDLVPAQYWVQTGLVEEHRALLQGLNAGITTIDAEGATRSFIRHKFAELDEVPETYYSVSKKGPNTRLLSVALVQSEDSEVASTHVASFMLAKNDPLLFSSRRSSSPTFIKIWDENDFKYRLYEANPSNELQFKEVQPLGEPRNYWEVQDNPDGRKRSAHPANKNSGSPAPWDGVAYMPSGNIIEKVFGVNTSKYVPSGHASAAEVIANLAKYETDVTAKKMLERLVANAHKMNVPIHVGSINDYLPGHRARAVFLYQKPDDIKIIVDPNEVDNEKDFRHVLIHELAHAYSVGIIEHPATPEEEAFVRNLKRLLAEIDPKYWHYMMGQWKRTGKDKHLKLMPYGFTNAKEFLAELASNPEFRRELRRMSDPNDKKYENANWWQRIIRLFRNLFFPEVKKQTEKDQIDEMLDQWYTVLDATKDLTNLNYGDMAFIEATKEVKLKGKKKIDILQQMLSSLEVRIDKLRREGKRKQATKAEKTLEDLEKLVGSNRNHAILKYLVEVQQGSINLNMDYITMSKDPAKADPEKIQSMIEQLTSYSILEAFKTQIRKHPLDFAPDAEASEHLLKKVREIQDMVHDLEAKVKDLRLERYAYLVYNTSKDPNKDLAKIKDELEVASKDISLWNHWTGGGTEQRDYIVTTNHQLMRKAHSEAHRQTQADLYAKDSEEKDISFRYYDKSSTSHSWSSTFTSTGIYKALEEYEKWLPSQGISSNSIVDKFKPILDMSSLDQTSDSVKFISPASDEGRAILAKPKGDPLRQFYETLVLGYIHSQENIPRHLRPGLRLPSIQRSLLEAVVGERNIGDKLSRAFTEGLYDSIRKRYDEVDRKAVDEAGNPIKGLPVRFIAKHDGKDGRLTPREVSLDVATTVGLFMHEAHLRDNLSPIINDLELGKGIAKDREVVKASKRLPGFAGWLTSERDAITLMNGKLETMKGENSEAYKKVVQDLEMLAYGEYKKDEGDIKIGKAKFDIAKTTDSILKFTGFNLLFGRMAIPLTNALVGKLTQIKEAIGGNIINPTDMWEGDKFYATQAIQSLADLGQREKKTKFGKFFSFMNPLDSERPVFDIGISTNYRRTIFEKLVRSGNSTAEFYMGASALGSVLNKDEFRAEEANGKKASLYDAMEINDSGKPVLRKGYTYHGKKTIDGNDMNEFRDYVLRTYQIMNGVYNKMDAGNTQQSALGRSIMFMRRWLPEGVNTRWRTRFWDPRLNKENEGHYVSALVQLNNIFGRDGFWTNTAHAATMLLWMGNKDSNLLLHPTELDLSDEQKNAIITMRKANIRKTLFELYTIASLLLLASFGWDDKDDDSYVRYMMVRVSRELGAFLSPSTAWDVLRSPTVAMNTTTGMGKIVNDIVQAGYATIAGNELPTYEQGDYQGQLKLTSDIKRQFGLGFLEQFDNLDTKSSLLRRGLK